MAVVYVSPTGTGSKTGASATNALPVTSLDKAIQLAGPGGTVMMLADKGAYNLSKTVNISHGGTATAPVTIMGIDSSGNEQNITVNGTRAADWKAGMAAGNEIFKLLAGANNLVFENMSFYNVGTAFRVAADVSNITIEDMYADNVRRFFEDCASTATGTATISGLTIRNVEVHGFSKGVVRLQYDTNNVLIENVWGDSEHQDGDGIAIGIHLDGTVHNVVVRGSTMMNALSTATDYWNGDGFATERGVYDVTFENTVATGNADGGYDIKSSATTLINAVAEANGRNFRLWGEVTLIEPVGLDPHRYGGTGAQVQIQTLDGAKVTIIGGSFSDSGSSTKVVLNDGGSITFSGTHFVHASGGIFQLGASVFGVDPALVAQVAATGGYSLNGAELLAALEALLNPASGGSTAPTGSPAPPPADDTPPESGSGEDSSGETEGDTAGGSSGETSGGTPSPGDSSTGNSADEGAFAYHFVTPGSGSFAVEIDGDNSLLVNQLLYDPNGDGIIEFGPGGILNLEETRRSAGDMVATVIGATALRYLGVQGVEHVYANAAVRPNGAIEGKLGNDALKGTSSADLFFFDTALGFKLGSDAITAFGSNDRIVTTNALQDPNGDGLIAAGSGSAFQLGDAIDPANQLAISEGRSVVSTLEYDGSTTVNGVTYYVYSLPGGEDLLSL